MNDLRLALRSLRKAPGFTSVAVVTLALAIGANTTMFSVVYGVLLRPLPYPAPERIVQLAQTYGGQRDVHNVTYPQFRYLDERRELFQYLAATTGVGFNLFTGDAATRVSGLHVSREYFRVLGVTPQLGREFTAEEDAPSGPATAILSNGLWERQFGSDPGIVGRTVLLDGRPFTVVGVMPADFQPVSGVDVWSTLAQVGRTIGSGQNLDVLGRLRPGVSLAQARTRTQALTSAFREEFSGMVSQDIGLDLFPYQDLVAGPVRTPVRVLFGAIGFVLLIACANVANLVLGRATTRERELALRAALGAGRGRLLRGLVAESMILALAGGALGLLLANWGLQGLLAIVPAGLPRAETIRLDGWAFAFTFGLSLLTGIVFGLAPAWRTARRDLHERLREGTGRATEGMARGRARGALVVGEVALSVVLLVGATLLLRTFANLVRNDAGFVTDHLLTAEIWLRGTRYDSTGTIGAFYRELTERLEALPGVRSAAVVEAGLPLQRGGNLGVQVDGEWLRMASEYRTVTPNYLQVLGVPLVRGRMFTAGDAAGAEPVAIVNQAFAQRHLGDADAVGRVVQLGGDAPRRVVGVVGNLKSFIGAPAAPGVFIPSAQTSAGMTRGFSSWYPIHVVVRTAVEPAVLGDALARTIRETDAAVPVGRVRAMEEVLAGSLAFQRFVMLLLSLFAGMGVALAAVGIYGVMSYSAARRTHEIGVRLALGAVPGEVVRLVLRRGMALTGAGVVLGLAGALALTRLLASTLFGVTPTDPLTFGAVTALLAVVALMACYLPARRAASGDPVEALRYE